MTRSSASTEHHRIPGGGRTTGQRVRAIAGMAVSHLPLAFLLGAYRFLDRPPDWWTLPAAILLGLPLAALSYLIVSGGRKASLRLFRAGVLRALDPRALLWSWPSLWYVVVAFTEELFWRGAVQQQLGFGVLLTSLVFALLHWLFPLRRFALLKFVDLLFFSLALGWLFKATENIYLVIGCHYLRNILIYRVLQLRQQERLLGNRRIPGLGLFRAAASLSPILAYRLLLALSRAASRFDAWIFRNHVERNLARVYPDMRPGEGKALAGRYFISASRKKAEDTVLMAAAPDSMRRLIRRMVRTVGEEHFEEALERGRGVILATGHFGALSWVVAQAVHGRGEWLRRNPVLYTNKWDGANQAVIDARTAEINREYNGSLEEVLTNRGLVASLRPMLEGLRRRQAIVVIGVDGNLYVGRGARRAPLTARLLGLTIPSGAGAAWLAVKTGAPLIPVFALRRPAGRVEVVFGSPIVDEGNGDTADRIARLNQRIFDVLEQQIRKHPEQWLFWDRLHRLAAGRHNDEGSQSSERGSTTA